MLRQMLRADSVDGMKCWARDTGHKQQELDDKTESKHSLPVRV